MRLRRRHLAPVFACIACVAGITRVFASAVTGYGLGATSGGLVAPWAITGFLSAGQSTSVGDNAAAYDAGLKGNLALFAGYYPFDASSYDAASYYDAAFAGMYFGSNAAQPIRPYGGNGPGGDPYGYPTNLLGPCCDRVGDEITVLALASGYSSYQSVEEISGQSGTALSGIASPNPAYEAGLSWSAASARLATAAGKTFGVGAIFFTHGESDADIYNTAYATGLQAYRAQWNSDMAARTGQARNIRLYFTVEGSSPIQGEGQNLIANQLWQLALSDSNFVNCGPRYAWYGAVMGGLHQPSYIPNEEKEAEAYWTNERGGNWQPTQPTTFARASNVVTVTYDVPFAPLVFDATNGRNMHTTGALTAWANGYGFETLDQRIPAGASAIANNGSGLVRLTWPAHGLTTGNTIWLTGLYDGSGPWASNGVWTVTVIDSSHFDLQGSTYAADASLNFYQATASFLITISSVAVSGNQVTITLARAPVGSTLEISYAHYADTTIGNNNTGGWSGGEGRGGALRDSDPFVGISGNANYNWGIEFCYGGGSGSAFCGVGAI